jgi:hypothetical protein
MGSDEFYFLCQRVLPVTRSGVGGGMVHHAGSKGVELEVPANDSQVSFRGIYNFQPASESLSLLNQTTLSPLVSSGSLPACTPRAKSHNKA